jgi:uncharacterized protein YcfL
MKANLKLSLLLTALALVGCKHVNPPIEGRDDPFRSPQVTFADASLRDDTAISPPRLQRDDAGNLLHVTLPIRSAVNKTITVDYKVSWYDRAGAVLSETGWMAKTLEANTPETITMNSTSDRAADFRIALRKAK